MSLHLFKPIIKSNQIILLIINNFFKLLVIIINFKNYFFHFPSQINLAYFTLIIVLILKSLRINLFCSSNLFTIYFKISLNILLSFFQFILINLMLSFPFI